MGSGMEFIKKTLNKIMTVAPEQLSFQKLNGSKGSSSQPNENPALDELPSLPSSLSSKKSKAKATPVPGAQAQSSADAFNNPISSAQREEYAPPKQQQTKKQYNKNDYMPPAQAQAPSQAPRYPEVGQQQVESQQLPPVQESAMDQHYSSQGPAFGRPQNEQASPFVLPPLTESLSKPQQPAESKPRGYQMKAMKKQPSSVKTQSSVEVSSQVPQEASQHAQDQSLFFNVLRAKLEDQGNSSSVVDELSSHSTGSSYILGRLRSHWHLDKQQESLVLLDQKIKEKMQPLELLEQEWRMLHRDMEMLSKRLDETESEIKQSTTDLLGLIEQKIKKEKDLQQHPHAESLVESDSVERRHVH